MDQIPPLGWVAIIIILAIFGIINLGLISILRNRSQFNELSKRLKARPPSQSIQTIERVKEVLRDPFGDERRQVDELSRLVSGLKEHTQTGDPPEASQREEDQK